MTIDFLHVCENAFVSQNNNLNLIQIFTRINARGFPAVHSVFFVVVGVRGEDGGRYPARITITQKENAAPIADLSGTLDIPEDGGGANFIGRFINVQFPRAGVYKIEATVGNERRDTVIDVEG